MYDKDKRSFFERLTGTINVEEEERSNIDRDKDDEIENVEEEVEIGEKREFEKEVDEEKPIVKELPKLETFSMSEEEGELAVDVYEDGSDIYVQAMIAGVNPENIDVTITREMVTLRGKRVNQTHLPEENYFHKELYWGGFSRKILLPEEIDSDRSEAIEKHGLLTLKLPKLNKTKTQKLEVRSIE
jgi:HSP20 family protein